MLLVRNFLETSQCLAVQELSEIQVRFKGLFANSWKASISSSCLSVHPSARMEQFGSHWVDFHEIWYLSILRISVEKIKVDLKWDKNNGYFTCRSTGCTCMRAYRWILFKMKNIPGKICRDKTYIVGSVTLPEYRVVYETMWKKRGRYRQATDDNIIPRFLRIACWMTKATDTHSECAMVVSFHGNNG